MRKCSHLCPNVPTFPIFFFAYPPPWLWPPDMHIKNSKYLKLTSCSKAPAISPCRSSSGVSICTVVPVSKYFCTSKTSEHLFCLGFGGLIFDLRSRRERLLQSHE